MIVFNKAIPMVTTDTDNYSEVIPGDQLFSLSGMAVFSDSSASGTISIQYSNDVAPQGFFPGPFTPTNWLEMPDSSATASVSSGATTGVRALQVAAKWYRFHWEKSGGAGTIAVYTFGQGA